MGLQGGGRNGRALSALAALVLAASLTACTREEPRTLDDHLAAISACPTGDAPWRAMLASAQESDRLADALAAAESAALRCATRWEPLWAVGEIHKRNDRTDEATRAFEEALARAETRDDATGISCAAAKLAWQAFARGDLDSSIALHERAIEAAERASRVDLASFARNNAAGALADAGRYAEAIVALEEASRGLQALGMAEAARGAGYNGAVLSLELGDAHGARERLVVMHAEAVRADDSWTRTATAIVLGHLDRELGALDGAARWFAGVESEDPAMLARAALGRGRVAIAQGDAPAALENLARARDLAAEVDEVVALVADAHVAEAEWMQGRRADAQARLARVAASADAIGAGLPAWSARALQGKFWLDEGDAGRAVAVLEEAVARLDAQGGQLDPSAEGLRFLRERVDPYVDLAAAWIARDGGRDARALARVAELSRATKARALRHAARERDDAPVAIEESGATLLARVRAGLAPGEALIDTMVGTERSVALVITRERILGLILPGRRAWLSAYEDLRATLTANDGADGDTLLARRDRAARTLGDALLAPLAPLLADVRRVAFVADRELALLPFELLSPAPGATTFGATHDLALLPILDAAPRVTAGEGAVVLLGSPVLAPDSGLADLPWTALELETLRDVWRAREPRIVAGDQLVAARVTEAVRGTQLVHFATHAEASTRDPRRSGVILSHGERLELERVAELDLDGALVILSACRTGEGEIIPGEGIVGLGWAFMRAGARAVVVSRWPVQDRQTASLMAAIHDEMHEGGDVVEALARAQRRFREQDADPRVGAAFAAVLRPGAGPRGPQADASAK